MWTVEVDMAFESLKVAMTQAPVLQLPDFTKTFVMETDACSGLGAVLMIDHYPLTFLSKVLGVRNLGLSIYEKEFLAIILAVDKWRPYLLHAPFVIKTDQRNLKYLLEQKISTPLQHEYLTKLLGFDYTNEFRNRVENKAADTVSRKFMGEGECGVMTTTLKPVWVEELVANYQNNKNV